MLFTGGEDVTPAMYGERKHKTTGSCQIRDMREQTFYEEGIKHGAKMVGICRGAQFLTVMNGGKLIQNIYGHSIAGTHPLHTSHDTEVGIQITSTHHQCMYPFNLSSLDYELIAWGDYLGADDDAWPVDYPAVGVIPEVVWYPQTNCLCVQGHPEYMPEDSSGYQYFQFLLEHKILENVNE